MAIFNWNEENEGTVRGTFQTREGHILLVGVPKDDQTRHDEAITEFTNSLDNALNPRMADVVEFLVGKGAKRRNWGEHVAYGPIAEATEDASSAAPLNDNEQEFLTEEERRKAQESKLSEAEQEAAEEAAKKAAAEADKAEKKRQADLAKEAKAREKEAKEGAGSSS